ncbi:RNA polymerase ECF-type sigma factor [Pedobacter sp. BAL39]|nr:RNA polymerase ECF-type sigma factor [Pedobacter sp. BAL39]
MVKPDLTELWKQFCVDDNVKAFEGFYYAMFNKLVKFCVYYTANQEAAEEIVSEIFVKCWNNRKNLSSVERPVTYVFVAVKNQSLKHNKKHGAVHMVEIDSAEEHHFADLSSDPSTIVERKELQQQLDRAIDTLPMQARVVFRLIKEGGLKYKEVAELMNISHRTVQTHLFRSIAKLREVLKPRGVPPAKDSNQMSDKLMNIIMFTAILKFIYIFYETCRQFKL